MPGARRQEIPTTFETRPADDDRPDSATLQQADPTQDQGAHDTLAQVGFLNQQIAEPV